MHSAFNEANCTGSRMTYYVAGILLAGLLPVLPPIYLLVLFAGVLPIRLVPLSGRAFLLGICVASLWGHWQLFHRAVEFPPGNEFSIYGYVDGLPEQQYGRLRFNFSLIHQPDEPEAIQRLRTVRLSWYRAEHALWPGQRLKLTVRLFKPAGQANPGGFDYPRWLLSRGLDATGYVRALALDGERNCCVMDRLRARLAAWLEGELGPGIVQATLAALLLGIKSGLGAEHWQTLRHTGTVHLVVISGLHIGFAALAGIWFGRALSRGFWPARQDQRIAQVLSALGLALFYMLLAGAALPTQRAVLMLAVFLLSWLWMRHSSVWQRWWLALSVVMTVSPLAFLEPGLWLSFAAVAILLWHGQVHHQSGLVWRTQLAIAVGMLPLLVAWFGGSSVLAPLINLVAIPFTAFLLLFSVLNLLLAAATGFSDLLVPTIWLIEGFWWLLDWAANLPLSYVDIPAPPWWALLLAAAGTLLLMQPSGFSGRSMALLLWLPMLAGPAFRPVSTGFEAWLFDVGQGLSLYVRSGEHHLLYDTGAAWRSGRSAFETAVLPALQRWRVDQLDMLMLSHGDNDHAGGRHRVLTKLNPAEQITGSRWLAEKESYQPCRSGQQWQWGETRLSLLAGSRGIKENSRSCVLHISHGNCQLLATGDIGFAEERRLEGRPVHWLLASHHGSKYGTSGALLDRMKPAAVLISAGRNNPFGHPHPDMLRRAQERNIPVFATATSGALRLWIDENGQCRTSPWRAEQSRYWQIP